MADQSLIDYIKKCKGLGRTDAQVRTDLIKVGWDASDVDFAFSEMSPAAKPPTTAQGAKPSALQAAQRLGEEGKSPKISPLSMLPNAAKNAQQAQPEQQPMQKNALQTSASPQAQPASQAQASQQQTSQAQPTSLAQAAQMQQAAQKAQPAQQNSQFPQLQQAQQPLAAGPQAKKSSPLGAIFSNFGKKQPAKQTTQPMQQAPQQPQSQQNPQATLAQPEIAQAQFQQNTQQPASLQQPPAQATLAQQQTKPQSAFGAGAKQPPIKILAAALFVVLILIGAYMYINATKPAQPLKPTLPSNTSAVQNTSAHPASQIPQQPPAQPAQNQTSAPAQPSTPPPPPPLPTANAAATPPPSSSPPSSSLGEQIPLQTNTSQANASQSNASSAHAQTGNTSSPPANTLYPSELGLPPGVVQSPPVIPKTNASSQNKSANQTNATVQSSSVKNATNQTTSPAAPQITYPIRLWRTVKDEPNPRHFCYSLDKNYLRAYYYEYKGDYCNGAYEMKGFNWTFEQIDFCANMPCCYYNATTKLSRNYIYFQCDSD